MKHTEGHLKGVRDIDIYYQTWLPKGEIKAAVIIMHGLGEHSGRYDNVVNHLVPLGYALYGFDLIGHGKSGGAREFVQRYEDYPDSLTQYLEMVRGWLPDKPHFLLGHSMGGSIASDYLITHSENFRGAVISAPTVIIPDYVNQLMIIGSKVLSKLAPKMGIMALDPNGVSKDPKVVQAYIDDPLVFHGKTTARLGAELLKLTLRINKDMEQITTPLIIIQGSEDKLSDPQGAQLLYDRVSSEDKTLKIYDGLHHEVFNEPERDQVLGDVAAWLDEHL